jgi:hypothetical protein
MRSKFLFAFLALAACGGDDDPPVEDPKYVLASVVIDADGARTTYVQTIASLDDGPFDNTTAIELPGNGVVMSRGREIFVGLAEEPTWVRYTVAEDGAIAETGRISFLDFGVGAIDYGNVLVDDDTAVSVLGQPPVAIVWNPTAMEIVGEIPLDHLSQDEGYQLEVWTTVAHDGLVYVPGRWSDWAGSRIRPGVVTTILDPHARTVVGVAEDDRCASGGRIVFDEAGYGYVMGDGRNYAIQMFANAGGTTAPDNCLLRIAPGTTDFEADYVHTIPSLTGGLQSITELHTARQGSGLGFAKMFYPDELPAGVEPVDFAFWGQRAHKMWRIHLTDPPTAEEVEDLPFSTIGFDGTALDGHLYAGESPDGATSEIYEIDPDANTAQLRFTMQGYFYGLYELR